MEKLIEDVARLPEADRIRLVERGLASLDGEPDPGAADAWAEEIKRRSKEIDDGLAQPIPWSEVKDAADRELRDRH